MSERNEKVDQPKTISRREFLSGAGMLAAGAFGVASTSKLTTGRNQAGEYPAYEKLDVEQVRKLGHLGYYEGACSYGAFNAVVSALGEKVGEPYASFPTMLMKFGEGGVVGWGSLCGGLNGACAAIGLIAGEDYKPLVNELVAWYSNTPLPTDISNELAVNHEFLVSEYKSDQSLEQSVSDSTLCHVSVTNWCKASGLASGSSERSERCGRLTGDVAAYAVELLNAHADGTFEPVLAFSEETETCRTCHSKGKDFELGQWTRGKEECTSCHEPHD
ncbi:MAG: C-GCAxxG-C-C family protein [Planctomycetota bacterium]|jgi:hypothetical protein